MDSFQQEENDRLRGLAGAKRLRSTERPKWNKKKKLRTKLSLRARNIDEHIVWQFDNKETNSIEFREKK